MNYKLELLKIPNTNLENEFEDLKYQAFKFKLKIDGRRVKSIQVISRLIEAHRYFSICKSIMYNLINKEDNEYLKEYEDYFPDLVESLGRIDKRLDELQHETIKGAEDMLKYASVKAITIKMQQYENLLHELMVNLIILPLKRAYQNYSIWEEKSQKNRKLIESLIFIELYRSAQVMGAYTRQQNIAASAGISLDKLKRAFHNKGPNVDEKGYFSNSDVETETESYPEVFLEDGAV